MKKLFIALVGVLSIGATVPVVAGDDRQSDRLRNMEQARRAKLAHIEKEAAPLAQMSKFDRPTNSRQTDEDTERDKMMKECAEMMKSSA